MITAIMPNRPESLKDRSSEKIHIRENIQGIALCNCLITLIQRHPPVRATQFQSVIDSTYGAGYTILIAH